MVVQDVTEPVVCDLGVQTDLPTNQRDQAMQTDLDPRAVEDDQQQHLTENIKLKEKLGLLSGNGFPSQNILFKDDQLVNSYAGVSSFEECFVWIYSCNLFLKAHKVSAIHSSFNETENEYSKL